MNKKKQMNKSILLLLMLLLLSSGDNMFAQKRTNDAAGWFSLSVKQNINNRLSYRVMARLRDVENFGYIKSYYVDGGLYYAIKNNFTISLNLVYAPSKDYYDLSFRTYYQYYTSINNKILLSKYFYLSNRIIIQRTSNCFIIDNGSEPYSRTDLREKLVLNRLINKRNKIYIGDEIMTTLFTKNTELRRNRLYIGLTHKISRRVSTDLFFVLQSTFNRKNNTNDYVYGITLNYKFKKMMNDD